MNTKVPDHVVREAYRIWCQICERGPVNYSLWNSFWAFIGYQGHMALRYPDLYMTYEMPEAAARKVNLLFGPHSTAIVKAWLIREGLEDAAQSETKQGN